MKTKTRRAVLAKAQCTLLQVTALSQDQYNDYMYQHGTAFAEEYCKRFLNKDDMTTALLANKNYWDWWRFRYVSDDAAIIYNNLLDSCMVHPDGTITLPATYPEIKSYMIGDQLLETDLSHLLKKIK